MHAIDLIDPDGAGLPPRLDAGIDGERVYWHLDESGMMQEAPPSSAIEPWNAWQTAVCETRDVFRRLCKEFGKAGAQRISREAMGAADSEYDNCALLEEFIFYKLPVGEFARRKGGEERAKALEKQLRRLLLYPANFAIFPAQAYETASEICSHPFCMAVQKSDLASTLQHDFPFCSAQSCKESCKVLRPEAPTEHDLSPPQNPERRRPEA